MEGRQSERKRERERGRERIGSEWDTSKTRRDAVYVMWSLQTPASIHRLATKHKHWTGKS